VINKKADVVRVYLPPDANCLLSWRITASAADYSMSSWRANNSHRSGGYGRAIAHCTAGLASEWASNDQGGEPDVVMACCGDVPRSKPWLRSTYCANICRT